MKAAEQPARSAKDLQKSLQPAKQAKQSLQKSLQKIRDLLDGKIKIESEEKESILKRLEGLKNPKGFETGGLKNG